MGRSSQGRSGLLGFGPSCPLGLGTCFVLPQGTDPHGVFQVSVLPNLTGDDHGVH
jgi:hypothetical protein